MHSTSCPPENYPRPGDCPLQAALVVLSIAYLLWLQGTMKDLLLSTMEPYPYTACFATTIVVAGGFVSLFLTWRPGRWRDSLLGAGLFLTVGDLLGILPKELGIFPGVSASSLAFGVASLLSARRRPRDGNEKLYAAVVVSGAVSLFMHSVQSEKLWAVFVVLVVVIVSSLAVWLAEPPSGVQGSIQKRRGAVLTRFCSIVIVGLFGILLWLNVGRSVQFRISDASMLGLGLGWYWKTQLGVTHVLSFATCLILALLAMMFLCERQRFAPVLSHFKKHSFPASLLYFGSALGILAVSVGQARTKGTLATQQWLLEPFGPIVATEFGLITVLALGLVLWIAVGIGVMRLFRVRVDVANEAQEVDIALWAGSISSLYAAILVTPLGHPFMTCDSVGGTMALAMTVASVGIQSPTGSQGHTLLRRELAAFRKKRNLLLLIGSLVGVALVLGIGAGYYDRSLVNKIVPYMNNGTPPDFPPGFVALFDISTTMQDATIASEDPGFYEHHGFEWKALHSALRLNMSEGRVITGHSTITQQLAKNVFLKKERTFSRKAQEVILTFEMERLLSKQRILELYLNLIDFGMEQHGISNAAQYYFHKTPKELTLAESAMLAGLIPRPIRSLSFYQLSVGQHRSLNLMNYFWGDRYPVSDTDQAKAIPVQLLLRLSANASEPQQNAQNQQDEAHLQYSKGAVRQWNKVGLLIVIGVTCGVILAIALGVRALRVATRARGGLLRRLVSLEVLLCVAFWSVFATLGLHWYQINRELALTTILHAYRHSPNYDLRPQDSHINCVVLHASTQHTLDATIRAFQYPKALVSAHFVVGKEGRVFQIVPLERRAWHAGISELDGETDVNNFSVGIELVNLNDGTDPYPDLQYEAVARLIFQLRQRYQIPDGRIVSHRQIALPLGRKSDPLGFDFERLYMLLNSFSVVTPL